MKKRRSDEEGTKRRVDDIKQWEPEKGKNARGRTTTRIRMMRSRLVVDNVCMMQVSVICLQPNFPCFRTFYLSSNETPSNFALLLLRTPLCTFPRASLIKPLSLQGWRHHDWVSCCKVPTLRSQSCCHDYGPGCTYKHFLRVTDSPSQVLYTAVSQDDFGSKLNTKPVMSR